VKKAQCSKGIDAKPSESQIGSIIWLCRLDCNRPCQKSVKSSNPLNLRFRTCRWGILTVCLRQSALALISPFPVVLYQHLYYSVHLGAKLLSLGSKKTR